MPGKSYRFGQKKSRKKPEVGNKHSALKSRRLLNSCLKNITSQNNAAARVKETDVNRAVNLFRQIKTKLIKLRLPPYFFN